MQPATPSFFQSADFDVTVPWTADGFSLLYSRGQLRLSFATAKTLTNRETPVSISESSLISRGDEDYTKFNHEVVRGVKLHFKLPPSFRFAQSACACCLSAYDLNGRDNKADVMTFEDGGRTAVLEGNHSGMSQHPAGVSGRAGVDHSVGPAPLLGYPRRQKPLSVWSARLFGWQTGRPSFLKKRSKKLSRRDAPRP